MAGGGFGGRTASGVLWMTGQKWVSRAAGMLTIVVLTRLLSPTDFGLVAVAMSVVPFVYLLSDLGFTAYLVQVEDPRPRDFSTAFWYSAGSSLALALILGMAGRPLERLLDAPGLAPVMWGLAPAVLFVGLGAVPAAVLRRQLRFRAVALQTVIAATVGQVVAVAAALAGTGVWALVLQTVVTQAVTTALGWRSAGWKPTLEFSWSEFVRMFRYGASVVNVEVVALLRTWAENAIIVAHLGLTAMGYLSIAQRLVQVAQDLTASAVTPVTTVVFAQIRADRPRLSAAYLRSQAVVYAVVVASMMIIVSAGPSVTQVVFGSGWDESVVQAQALALAGILTAGAALDHGLLYGLGRPGLWLGYAVVVDAATVAVTAVLASRGLGAVALGFVGVALGATLLRWPMVSKQLRLPVRVVALQFGRALLVAVLAGGAGIGAYRLTDGLPDLVRILLVLVAVGAVWVGSVRLLLSRALSELVGYARSIANRARRGVNQEES